MRMIQKLKLFEQTVVFLRWATDAEFGKILYVGEDFVEFLVLNPDTMESTLVKGLYIVGEFYKRFFVKYYLRVTLPALVLTSAICAGATGSWITGAKRAWM